MWEAENCLCLFRQLPGLDPALGGAQPLLALLIPFKVFHRKLTHAPMKAGWLDPGAKKRSKATLELGIRPLNPRG
jgi:hypothetical protein